MWPGIAFRKPSRLAVRVYSRACVTLLGSLLLAVCATRPAPRTTAPAAEENTAHMIQEALEQTLSRALADSAFPGAFAAVGNHAGVLASWSVGSLDWSERTPPNDSTLWDLASLTKVLGTTSAIMLLVQNGEVVLDATVSRYLPRWRGERKERVTIRDLLLHRAGLPPFQTFYRQSTNRDSVLALIYAVELDTIPGARTVYSDIGFMLLGEVVSAVSGQPLDRFLSDGVFGPLGMTSTGFLPAATLLPRIAPTEVDPWRGRHIRGEVHDENAYALGGVAGHAGLFSTGRDLARIARMYLGGGSLDGVKLFDAGTVAQFTTVYSRTESTRALGWDTPDGRNSAGTLLSSHAFGHTGFTGTSIWIDPEQDLFVILLSNRVNPSRANNRISQVRRTLADAVVGALRRSQQPSRERAP